MANDNLALRKQIKRKKPSYARQNGHKNKEVSRSGWRKPKGKHSKIRKQLRNRHPLVQVGYGSPQDVAGLLPSGLVPQLVFNVADLAKLDAKKDAAVIGAGVGMRKRLEIVKAAQEKKITLANVKNAETFVADYEKLRKELSSEKSKKKESREKKAKESEKKAEKKAEETIDKKVEDKADSEKKEALKKRENVLTQKQKD